MYKLFFLLFLLFSYSTKTYTQYLNNNEYEEIYLYDSLISSELEDSLYHKALTQYRQHKKKQSPIYREELNRQDLSESLYNSAFLLSKKINDLLVLSDKAAKQKNKNLELDAMTQAFLLAFWGDPANYSKAFNIALSVEKRLSALEESVRKKYAYLKLGEAYYLFKEYGKSIALLKNILQNESGSFEDTTNVEAWAILGICYANINKMDSSDYYFKLPLKSKDIILNRPMYNAIAISHLACNSMLKKEYDKALVLFNTVLPVIKTGEDYGHIAGMYYGIGNSLFNTGKLEKVRPLIDSILLYANKDKYNRVKRLKQAYTLGHKFYLTTGDIQKAQICNDSLISYYKTNETRYTSQYILHSILEANDQEIITQHEKITYQKSKIIVITLITFGIIFISIFILILYLRKKAAYKILVRKNEEWAFSESNGIRNVNHEPTQEDLLTMSRINHYVVHCKNYRNSDLNINLLVHELSVNRSYISKAINVTTGKTFSEWLNDFRIKEAICLLSEIDFHNFSIDKIAFDIGFNNRTTFYRAFKKHTGLSPTTYLKTKQRYKDLDLV